MNIFYKSYLEFSFILLCLHLGRGANIKLFPFVKSKASYCQQGLAAGFDTLTVEGEADFNGYENLTRFIMIDNVFSTSNFTTMCVIDVSNTRGPDTFCSYETAEKQNVYRFKITQPATLSLHSERIRAYLLFKNSSKILAEIELPEIFDPSSAMINMDVNGKNVINGDSVKITQRSLKIDARCDIHLKPCKLQLKFNDTTQVTEDDDYLPFEKTYKEPKVISVALLAKVCNTEVFQKGLNITVTLDFENHASANIAGIIVGVLVAICILAVVIILVILRRQRKLKLPTFLQSIFQRVQDQDNTEVPREDPHHHNLMDGMMHGQDTQINKPLLKSSTLTKNIKPGNVKAKIEQFTSAKESLPLSEPTANERIPLLQTSANEILPLTETYAKESLPLIPTSAKESLPLSETTANERIPLKQTSANESLPLTQAYAKESFPLLQTSANENLPLIPTSAKESLPLTQTYASLPLSETTTKESLPLSETTTKESLPLSETTANESLPLTQTSAKESLPLIQTTAKESLVSLKTSTNENILSEKTSASESPLTDKIFSGESSTSSKNSTEASSESDHENVSHTFDNSVNDGGMDDLASNSSKSSSGCISEVLIDGQASAETLENSSEVLENPTELSDNVRDASRNSTEPEENVGCVPETSNELIEELSPLGDVTDVMLEATEDAVDAERSGDILVKGQSVDDKDVDV